MTSAVLIMLFAMTLIYTSVVSRIEAYIKMISAQGFLLFLIAITDIISDGQLRSTGTMIIAVETLGLKTLLIPWYMMRVIRENEITREGEPYVPHFASLIVVTLICVIGILPFALMDGPPPLFFGAAFAAVGTGFFIIISRKSLISHVNGYIIIENGIFLLSLGVAKDMPFIVSMGVSLDIFLGIFLAGVFVKRIKGTFDKDHIDSLTDLKD
ncbi:MAG: hypothetical protein AABZ39_18200 [Spirochaetota bacterium]